MEEKWQLARFLPDSRRPSDYYLCQHHLYKIFTVSEKCGTPPQPVVVVYPLRRGIHSVILQKYHIVDETRGPLEKPFRNST